MIPHARLQYFKQSQKLSTSKKKKKEINENVYTQKFHTKYASFPLLDAPELMSSEGMKGGKTD